MITTLHIRAGSEILGAERVVIELAKHLPEFGVSAAVCVPIQPGEESEFLEVARENRVQVCELAINGPFDLGAIPKIRRMARESDIDIVHGHGYREDLYALSCRSFALPFATNHLWKRTDTRLRLYAKLDAVLLRFFHTVIAVSNEIRADMIERGIPSGRVHRIANGIELSNRSPDQQSVRSELGIRSDEIVVTTVSSLTSEKNIAMAIRAFDIAHQNNSLLRMMVVGSGPDETELRQLALNLGQEKSILFLGRRSDVPTILANSDIFALPSRKEGLPIALLEAMAASLPVVATDVGDVSLVVSDENGALVPNEDLDKFANSIARLAGSYPGRRSLGCAARLAVEQNFSARAMARSYAKLYRDAAGS